MSFAAVRERFEEHEKAHALPAGALAGILQDFLQLVIKWLPQLLGGASAAEGAQMHQEFAALCTPHEQARGLPPGTLVGILQQLLPVLLQLLPGLLGGLKGGGPGPAPAPVAP